MKTNPLNSTTMPRLAKASLLIAIAALASFAFVGNAKAVTFDYSSTVGSTITFPGDHTFHFSPASNNFSVTSGSAAGLLGEITGTYTIGTISGCGAGCETASVTGSGTFVIHDGAFNLTGTLTWVDVTQILTSGVLNIGGTANLTGITYGGSNPDLVALAAIGHGNNVLTFQFIPAVTLDVLRNGPGAHSTSFSGTVTATPSTPEGGMTVALLGIGLAAIEGLRRKVKRAKN